MRLDYLKNLNEYYEKWISDYNLGKLLVINTSDLDFVERIDDFAYIVSRVDLELNNLFT